MRKLLTLVVVLILTGIAINPVQAQTIVMPALVDDGYIAGEVYQGFCGNILVSRLEYFAPGNEDGEYLNAIAFQVDGQESPYLVAMFWYVPGQDEPQNVTLYFADSNGQVQIVWLTYAQLENLDKGPCDFVPQRVGNELP